MDKFILAFDIGTTAIKAGLINISSFEVEEYAQRENKLSLSREGWAEQDPVDLWKVVAELARSVVNKKEVVAIVYATQMAGVLPIDREGAPLRNIIIWLDERGKGYPRDLWSGPIKVKGYNIFTLTQFLRISGGAPSATGKDPLSKILWLRDNEPEVYKKTHKFLDVKSYLIYKTTNVFVTSPDEANLTWLIDSRNGAAKWHDGLLHRYRIPREKLPNIKYSIEVAGRVTSKAGSELGVAPGTPVIVGSGDMTAAAIGSGAVEIGHIHIYIGTSDWIAAHIAKRKLDIFHYVGSILSAIPQRYLLVAEQEIAGSALDKIMKIIGVNTYEEVEELVSTVEPGAGGVIFLPWLYGERSPIDDPAVRGAFINISLRSGRSELLRAVMEGVALNIKWAYKYVERLAGYNREVRIVGGGALSDTWCQILADALERDVLRVHQPRQAVLRGAGAIAAVGLGIYKNFLEATIKFKIDKKFSPSGSSKIYNTIFREFIESYKKLKRIYTRLNRG